MDASELQTIFLKRLGIRIGPEMSNYVLNRLTSAPQQPIPVMGGNARTGVPIRAEFPSETLQMDIAPVQPKA